MLKSPGEGGCSHVFGYKIVVVKTNFRVGINDFNESNYF
jgi:hypothetical protein